MAGLTHIWIGPTTGSKGLLLIPGRPFDPEEHDYLDLEDAIQRGRAIPMDGKPVIKQPVAERAATPAPPVQPPATPKHKKRGKK